MKKNEIFEFTAPNGVVATGIVVSVNKNDRDWKWYTCYSQNRLVDYQIVADIDHPLVNILVDYCIIPEYDKMLEEYFHQQDIANDYADKEL